MTTELRISTFKPISLIALSSILYGFLGFLGSKLLTENFTLSSMLFWRFAIAALWMIGFSRSKVLVSGFSPIACALCYGSSSALYFMASHTIGTGLAMVVFFSYPIFVAFHMFYNQGWRFDKYLLSSLIAMPLGFLMLMDRGSNTPNTTGIILATLSAVSYATYIVTSKPILKTVAPNQFTLIVCIYSALISLSFALIEGKLTLPSSLEETIYLCALGILATAIPIQLLLEGLKEVSSLKASMTSVLEPVVTLLIGASLLSETISQLQVLGVFTVLIASLLTQVARD